MLIGGYGEGRGGEEMLIGEVRGGEMLIGGG